MIPQLDGTPVWAVVMTTSEVDEDNASVTTSVEVLAIARTERIATDAAHELFPHIPANAGLGIQKSVMIDE